MKEKKLQSLEFSMTVGCKIDCVYCPQRLLLENYFSSDRNRNSKLMFEDFKIALDKVQPGATISFCGMSEPFFNEECADMIVYAHEKGYKISLLTTLIGMKFEDFEKIRNIHFDTFVLHIPDEEMNSKFPITEDYLELFKLVNANINVDYYSCHGKIHHDISMCLSKEKYIGNQLGDRAGNLKKNLKNEDALSYPVKDGRIICYHGSERQIGGWSPVMLPDGTLVLCCMDYGMKHVLGNLITDSWEDIQNSKEFRYVTEGFENASHDILCRKCGSSIQVEMLPAMQIGKIIKERKCNPSSYSETNDIWMHLAGADNICVFGLGKLFRDHFFQEHWDEGLKVNLFADNNKELQGKNIEGIPCISAEQLVSENLNVVVVIFVKNATEIEKQLMDLGISNVLTVDKIYEEYYKNGESVKRRLTI